MSHEHNRAARFHSAMLDLEGCSLQHSSPCTVRSDIASAYDPGPCDGEASCGCEPGTFECGADGTSAGNRVRLFASSYRGENIAYGRSDPVSIFYLWFHEPDSSSECGFRYANGHRYNILSGNSSVIGIGQWDTHYTQDFGSGGNPDGLVSGVHYPRTGSSLELRANWYRAGGPTTAQVNIDGTCHAMTLERGTEDNGTWLTEVGGLSGCQRYYFHFTDDGEDLFYPTTGSYGIGCSTDWTADRAPTCGNTCTPDCSGRACGGDGCGGSCGSCAADETCSSGDCVPSCTPDCSGRECGGDGCGGSCGSCASDETCSAGSCVASCTPDCSGRECGGDGCGGSCGTCSGERTCSSGACVCATSLVECYGSCVDTRVDDQHCGSCTRACGAGERCVGGDCAVEAPDAGCVPLCDGRACGDDTCGGSCGTCEGAATCVSGGQCDCGTDRTRCQGDCVDLRSDRDHCGSCGIVCSADARCVGGTCVADIGPAADGGAGTVGGAENSGAGTIPAAGPDAPSGGAPTLEGQVGCAVGPASRRQELALCIVAATALITARRRRRHRRV
jgi:hypothetical protein